MQRRAGRLPLVASVLLVALAVPPGWRCAAAGQAWISPVASPVARRFEPPPAPFAAGHRGVDFDLPPGTPVVAAAGGRVRFAGAVAGDGLFVTIVHEQDLESTYSFLSAAAVAAGQPVAGGQVVGLSGDGHPGSGRPGLHFGVRSGGVYVDPEALLGFPAGGQAELSLGPLRPEPAPEAAAAGEVAGPGRLRVPPGLAPPKLPGGIPAEAGARLDAAGRWVGRAARGVGRGPAVRAASVATPWRGPWVRRILEALRPVAAGLGGIAALARPVVAWDAAALGYGLARGAAEQLACRGSGFPPPRVPSPAGLARGMRPPPPPNDNVVVALAGIGSSTRRGAGGEVVAHAAMLNFDFRTLGYADDRIFHFSYRGLGAGSAGPYRFHLPYSKSDTYRSIPESAKLLAAQLRAIHERHPERKVDLVGHSQGGLVAQYFVANLYRPSDRSLPPIDHLVTIASPHRGSDAAQLAGRLSRSAGGRLALGALQAVSRIAGLPPPGGPSSREMAEDSRFLAELARDFDPGAVKATTIAATFDLVVTPQHTRLPGAAHYTADLPNLRLPLLDHAAVVTAPSTRGIVYGALADRPAPCTALRNAFADFGPGRLLSRIQDGIGAGIQVATGGGAGP